MRAWASFLIILPLAAQVPDLGKLPGWAEAEARAALAETPPADADAWVLLQRTRFAYTGGGEIRKQTFRLVKVLTERGLNERFFSIYGLGGRTSKVKKLKGWNLRPDGEMVKLATDDAVDFGLNLSGNEYNTHVATSVALDRVTKNSYVAFESIEVINHPQGPVDTFFVLDQHATRRWELELAFKSESWFIPDPRHAAMRLEPRNLSPWVKDPKMTASSLSLRDLPARPRDEGWRPPLAESEPRVTVAFIDPNCPTLPSMESWDSYAGWIAKAYAEKFGKIEPVPLAGKDPKAGLEAMAAWMSRELTYKQVYLSPERGWVPESSAEVCRRHYGDCKDLASCIAGGALALGLKPHPVLASIDDLRVGPDMPVSNLFNHAICAIELAASLGYPAEVATPAGRFLIVDPTDRLTPLGWLGGAHRGRQVMVCLPDKALWVRVPDAAIVPERLDVRLQGAVGADGRLEADLTLTETGDAVGFRANALLGKPEELKKAVVARLELHGDTTLEIHKVSDPLDLAKPLVIEARLVTPKALKSEFGEWTLEPVGLPLLPPVVQKAGRPRRYPVQNLSAFESTCSLDLHLPPGLVPRLTSRDLETSFRTASWKAVLEGARLRGTFRMRRRDADFGFDRLEEGVKAAKADRSQLSQLREEAMTFVQGKP